MNVEILVRADTTTTTTTVVNHHHPALSMLESAEHDLTKSIWKHSRTKIFQNLVLISISCLLVQTAFMLNSTDLKPLNFYTNFQPSNESTLHTVAISNGNIVLFLFNLFQKFIASFILPQYLIKKFALKSTILISFFFLTLLPNQYSTFKSISTYW